MPPTIPGGQFIKQDRSLLYAAKFWAGLLYSNVIEHGTFFTLWGEKTWVAVYPL